MLYSELQSRYTLCFSVVYFNGSLLLCTWRTQSVSDIQLSEKKRKKEKYRCYRKTALLLFLLNIPIGGMIVLMVRTNSGFTYPGYIIYLSALYTFYTLILSIINLVKFHELGDLILSVAKVLNFISAMMSVLGLQTAMISRFLKTEKATGN